MVSNTQKFVVWLCSSTGVSEAAGVIHQQFMRKSLTFILRHSVVNIPTKQIILPEHFTKNLESNGQDSLFWQQTP